MWIKSQHHCALYWFRKSVQEIYNKSQNVRCCNGIIANKFMHDRKNHPVYRMKNLQTWNRSLIKNVNNISNLRLTSKDSLVFNLTYFIVERNAWHIPGDTGFLSSSELSECLLGFFCSSSRCLATLKQASRAEKLYYFKIKNMTFVIRIMFTNTVREITG